MIRVDATTFVAHLPLNLFVVTAYIYISLYQEGSLTKASTLTKYLYPNNTEIVKGFAPIEMAWVYLSRKEAKLWLLLEVLHFG